jgi:hypothetical protein
MEVALHPIASVWVGEITAKYLDKSKDGGNAKSGAHWAWEKDKVTGKSTPRLIETWQQQKEFCKSQGIARPSEMPNNWEVSADGTKTLNTVGMPGCEV